MGRGSWPNSPSAPPRTSKGIADPAWVRLAEPPSPQPRRGRGARACARSAFAAEDTTAHGRGRRTRAIPVCFRGHAWDAVQLVVTALREADPDSAKIRDGIEQTQRFVGADGIFTCSAADHNGLTEDAFVMVEIVDAKWKLLP